MAEPINLGNLTEEERGVLVEAIPLLRNKGPWWWDTPEAKELYGKWTKATNGSFSEGGYDQFRLAIHQMRKKVPLTYKNVEGCKWS